jgi:hypothetical protein
MPGRTQRRRRRPAQDLFDQGMYIGQISASKVSLGRQLGSPNHIVKLGLCAALNVWVRGHEEEESQQGSRYSIHSTAIECGRDVLSDFVLFNVRIRIAFGCKTASCEATWVNLLSLWQTSTSVFHQIDNKGLDQTLFDPVMRQLSKSRHHPSERDALPLEGCHPYRNTAHCATCQPTSWIS